MRSAMDVVTGSSVNPFDAFADFTSTGDFGSQSTNLEYAVLSSMLHYSDANANSDSGLFGAGGLLSPSQNPSSTSLFPSISTGYNDASGGSFPVRTATFGLPLAALEGGPAPTHTTDNIDSSSNNAYSAVNSANGAAATDNSLITTTGNGSGFTGATIDHDWAPAAEFAPAVHPSQSQIIRPTQMTRNISAKAQAPISTMGTMRVEDVYKHVDKPYVWQSLRKRVSAIRLTDFSRRTTSKGIMYSSNICRQTLRAKAVSYASYARSRSIGRH